MNLLKSTDPAPSKLSYKLNRLFYKLWFKTLLILILLVLCGVLAKNFLYKINYNGLIIFKTENKNEFSRLGFYKNDVILSNNKELFHFKNEEIRAFCDKWEWFFKSIGSESENIDDVDICMEKMLEEAIHL